MVARTGWAMYRSCLCRRPVACRGSIHVRMLPFHPGALHGGGLYSEVDLRDAWMQLRTTKVVPCLEITAGASPMGFSFSGLGWHYDGALVNSTIGFALTVLALSIAWARGCASVPEGCPQLRKGAPSEDIVSVLTNICAKYTHTP